MQKMFVGLFFFLFEPGVTLACDNQQVTAMLQGAVDEFTGDCANVAVRYFSRLFEDGIPVSRTQTPTRPVLDQDEEEGFREDEEMVRDGMSSQTQYIPVTRTIIEEAARQIERMIAEGSIQAVCSRTGFESASWGNAPHREGIFEGGEMEVNAFAVDRLAQDNRLPRSVNLLRIQEQVADSLLHETAHIFYSILVLDRGARPTWRPRSLTERFTRTRFWDGSRPSDFGFGSVNEFRLARINYHPDNWGNEETARQIANGIYLCSRGRAVGRVLGLGRE